MGTGQIEPDENREKKKRESAPKMTNRPKKGPKQQCKPEGGTICFALKGEGKDGFQFTRLRKNPGERECRVKTILSRKLKRVKQRE